MIGAFLRGKRQDYWSLHVSHRINKRTYHVPLRHRTLNCKSFAFPSSPDGNTALKTVALALTRSYNVLQRSTPLYQLVPAVGAQNDD
ncbi:hypothetical protein Taro_004571 [Colocasia esculenta]|uniref:Uncharacterized protein n=1 Tax=Colocasia esculenta TaxID=4460 RepID=A0A843TS31_COLES|nr:hypothetical protein [Colocasia esculenta]